MQRNTPKIQKNRKSYNKKFEISRVFSDKLELACDYLFVSVGLSVLKKIPGRVSVECDARLSYNKAETLKRARRIIQLFKDRGIGEA